ncbi:hypothetical protein ACFVH0_35950 [Streptomyces sp. NPDC127117]|uniref:hypothetical protein n=1 Tax=Streptomyces sp. NPDC127117 TaxID=3345368 RepID=UPI003642D29D
MTQWLAGMRITAARLNDYTPVALSSSVTPATGWAVTSFSARRAGGTVEWTVFLSRTGASLAAADAAGNIGDILACTLPANCCPGARYITQFDKGGTASGSVRIEASGACTLTSMDPTSAIGNGNTVTFSGTVAAG